MVALRGSTLGSHELQLGETEVPFGPGDELWLVTDGVLEAPLLRGGRDYGLRRLRRQVSRCDAGAPAERIVQLIQDVEQHCGPGPYDDDVTVVTLRARERGEA